ncbi:hypothetical protein KAH27_01370 [bacterium]|nr:hypothetical protein [bacterium]
MDIFFMLTPMIFGWSLVILALLFSGVGLIRQQHWLLFFSALLITPFSFYLGGGSGMWRFALLVPFSQFYAAYAIRKKKIKTAWMLVLPMILMSSWTVFLVLSQ